VFLPTTGLIGLHAFDFVVKILLLFNSHCLHAFNNANPVYK